MISTVAGGVAPGPQPATSVAMTAVSVAEDSGGDLFLSDLASNVVREVTPAGVETIVAGNGSSGYSGDGGPATSAALQTPVGLAIDPAGNVLIADLSSNRVRMVAAASCRSACAYGLGATTTGDIYTVVGNGTAGYSGDGGPAGAAELNVPFGLSIDAAGNLLVADSSNNVIRMVAAITCSSSCAYGLGATTGGDIYTVAGNGTGGYTGDGGSPTSAQLHTPTGVVVDSAGNLLIADFENNVVRMVAATGCPSSCAYGLGATTAGDIYTVAGNATRGYSGDGGPPTSAQLKGPAGVALDSAGNLLIPDFSNAVVRMVAAADCSSSCAYGMSATTHGDIYTIAGTGSSGFSGDAGTPTSAQLNQPNSVVVDPAGNLLIADSGNNRVRMVAAADCFSSCAYGLATTTNGDIYTMAGTGSSGSAGYLGDTGPSTSAQLNHPTGVALDGAGDLFIADNSNNVIRMVAASDCSASCRFGLATTKGDIYTVAGTGSSGYTGDGGPASAAQLSGPTGVATDRAGDLLISDAANNVVRLVAAADCGSSCAFGLGPTVGGDIYTLAGCGCSGYTGDGGPAPSAELHTPDGVAVDPAGNVLIADFDNAVVRMVAASDCAASCAYGLGPTVNGDIYTVAGNGVSGYSGDGSAAVSGQLAGPVAVATDTAGDLLVADLSNNVIRMVAASDCSSACPFGLSSTIRNDIYTVAGCGCSGYSGDGGPAVAAAFDEPDGVTVDSAGDLLIADSDNNRVRLVAASTCSSSCAYRLAATTRGDVYTVAGDGTADFAGDGGPASAAELNNPAGLAVDSAGNLLIADYDNNRIRSVAAALSFSPFPTGGFGPLPAPQPNPSPPSPTPTPAPPASSPVTSGGSQAVVPDGSGWWVIGSGGAVGTFGTAPDYGSEAGVHLNSGLVALVATPDGKGYWAVAGDGGVFTFGDARFFGSAAALHLAAPIVGMAATPDGGGYWLVGADGGVLTYGDAVFAGSAAPLHLAAPIVGMAATPDGGGYWLVGADGGVITYGNAPFFGSAALDHLSAPVVALAAIPSGGGYWVVTRAGQVVAFGAARVGAAPPIPVGVTIVGIFSHPAGYVLIDQSGNAYLGTT